MNNPFSVMKILSEAEAVQQVEREPNKWNVISIWGKDSHSPSEPEFNNPKDIVRLNFHDIQAPMGDMILCEQSHINEAIQFARKVKDEPLLIHCAAGICRSTAIGFLIMLDALKDISQSPVEDAIKYIQLVRPQACPNRHVIEVGIPLISRNEDEQIQWFRDLYGSSTFRRLMGG